MAGGKKKGFTVSGGGGSSPNSEINVTPLVDVVLVLLIIFMVVTPLLEKDIEVKVPDTEKTEDVTDVPPDQLIVSITDKGEFKLNADTIPDDQLVDKLKRVLAAKKADDKLVFFMPDDKANYGRVVKALDDAKIAGAQILGMMTEKVDNAAPTAPGTPGAPPTPAPGGAPPPAAP